MVAEGYRARIQPYVDRISRPFLRWSPNSLSLLAFAFCGAAAGVEVLVRFTSPILFLAVTFLVFLGGVFDVIDGDVARKTQRTSARGDLVDHVLDRYGDVLLLLGLAVSSYANPYLALGALVSLLLASYMGTQAQAVGAGRIYQGLLSRADRLLLLAAAAFIEFDLSLPWPWAPSEPLSRIHAAGLTFTVLDVLLVYFVVASQFTAVTRARSAYRSLPPLPPAAGP
jgi:archaetidylinositol phosphate synthase